MPTWLHRDMLRGVRFYSLPLSHMKRPRSCEQQNVSPVQPLMSLQDKISAHSNKALFSLLSPFPKVCFHWIYISIFSILLAHAFFKSASGFRSSQLLKQHFLNKTHDAGPRSSELKIQNWAAQWSSRLNQSLSAVYVVIKSIMGVK